MSLKIPTYVITMMGEPFSEAIAQDTLESLGKFGEQGQKFPATYGNNVDTHWKEHELKKFKISNPSDCKISESRFVLFFGLIRKYKGLKTLIYSMKYLIVTKEKIIT